MRKHVNKLVTYVTLVICLIGALSEGLFIKDGLLNSGNQQRTKYDDVYNVHTDDIDEDYGPVDIAISNDRLRDGVYKRAIQSKSQTSPSGANNVNSHTNETDNYNTTEGHHEDSHSTEHVSMHVATWNFEYVKGPFVISVFLIAAGTAKLGFHHANFLSSKVPESCLLIILGTLVGAIFYPVMAVVKLLGLGSFKYMTDYIIYPSTKYNRQAILEDRIIKEFARNDIGYMARLNRGVLSTGAIDRKEVPALTSDLFFLYLLPPIILESAFSLHDRTFFDNVGTVMIYAVLGTVFNCFLIGPSLFGVYKLGIVGEYMPEVDIVQCLVFSAVVVAVDPVAVLAIFQEIGVNNTLYFLVFGESLFNDAVTVVLYNMMKTLNKMDHITYDQILIGVLQFFVVSFGGLFIGVIFGCLTAILTKFTEHCRVVEPLAVFVFAYISYLGAEMFHFSGIISIIGCGLTQAQYAFHNISRKSYTTVKYFSKMMSATCDCVIFMFLGISLFQSDVLNRYNWHVGFICWTILFCLIYRFLVVFLLTFIINRMNRMRKIDIEEQFIMAYGGLRGAVAFSLVGVLSTENLPKNHFLTATLAVIFFTVFIQGSTIKPLVKLLRVKMEGKRKQLLGEEINSHVTDHMMAGIEEITGQRGEHYFREFMEHYNRKYFKRWLQREPTSFDEQIMHYFQKLALEQHFEHLAGNKMIIERYGSDTELTEDIELPGDGSGSEGEVEGEAESVGLPDIIIPIPSHHSSSEDINSEMDRELQNQYLNNVNQTRRRKSLFPVALTPDLETRLQDNPTATDIRKIMIPSRRQQQFKRLDKNLKSENSENDLISYLQNKQMRTRRLSTAVWNNPIKEEPEIEERGAPGRMRRKSVSAAAASNNYRRRLSLAVPALQTEQARKRGLSMGNVMRGDDSPAMRRFRFRQKKSGESSDTADQVSLHLGLANKTIYEEDESSPTNNSVSFGLHPNSSTVDTSGSNDSEKVKDRLQQSPPKSRLYLRGDRRAGRFVRARTFSDSSYKGDSSPVRGGSLKERPRSSTFDSSAGRSVPQKAVKFADTDPVSVRYVSPRQSPSARRKQFLGAHARSLDIPREEDEEAQSLSRPLSGDLSPSGRIRKNPSYNKALSLSAFEMQDTDK